MNLLELVKIPCNGYCYICCHCGTIIGEKKDKKEYCYGHLNETTFEAYYCEDCFKKSFTYPPNVI